MTNPSTRLGHIDALRGLAASCVLVQHTLNPVIRHLDPVGSRLLDGAVNQWFDLGRFGVVLFFLISGLVIPYSLKGDHALRRFAISRFFRLYPAFWVSVAATVFAGTVLGSESFTATQIMANLTMAPVLLKQVYVSGVYWTLFIELVFYALCALLFMGRQLASPIPIFLIGLGCIALPVTGIAARALGLHAPVLYLTAHLSFLLAGYLLRMAILDKRAEAKPYAFILTGMILAAMPLLAAQPDHSFTVSTPLGVMLAGAAAVGVFVIALARPFATGRIGLWLGAISYSIYLLHIPVSETVKAVVPMGSMVGALLFFVMTLTLTLLASSLVYWLIEKPSIAVGKTLAHRRRETMAMEVAP